MALDELGVPHDVRVCFLSLDPSFYQRLSCSGASSGGAFPRLAQLFFFEVPFSTAFNTFARSMRVQIHTVDPAEAPYDFALAQVVAGTFLPATTSAVDGSISVRCPELHHLRFLF